MSRLISFPTAPAVAVSRRRHRNLVAAAGRWALSRGVSLPADHTALWAATAEELGLLAGTGGSETTGPWRASHVPELLETVAAWGAVGGCLPPPGFTESLWHLFGFLAGTNRLHPASDSLHELRAAMVVFGTFDRFRPIAPPTAPEPTAA